MSVTCLYFAICDVCARPAGTDELQDTRAGARRAAKNLGWTVKGSATWCPEHAPVVARPAPQTEGERDR